MPIERLGPGCQTKGSFRIPIEGLDTMPIERLVMGPIERPCIHANLRAWPPCQSKNLAYQSKGLATMLIEEHCPCQSKGSFRIPIKWSLRMPIERYLKHHLKIFFFLRKGFMVNHVGEDLGKHERANFGVQHQR